MSDLRLSGLVKRYAGGGPAAVDNVSFAVAEGSLTALLGPSGCGKSTTMRLIAGLETPDAGSVLVGGRNVTGLPPESRNVSLVFQSHALFPHLTVEENIMFAMQACGQDDGQARRKAAHAIELVGLRGLERRRAPDLSGGQQQRVALARALALAPAVLLLDEPLSNVDSQLRRSLREEIRALQRQLGLTVVYVTHDQREALAVSDQIVLMNLGKVVQCGTPHELYERPHSEFVAGFMGEAGIFNAVSTGDSKVWLGPLQLAGVGAAAAGPVRVAVRPEAWRLGPATGAGLPGSVLKQTYLGKAIEYQVATTVGQVLALCAHTAHPHRAGAPVSLYLAAHGVCVLGGQAPRDSLTASQA